MTVTKHIFLAALVLSLSACNPMPHDMKPADAQELASHISYIKDGHGICYALLASASYGAFNIVSLTIVPCDKVGL